MLRTFLLAGTGGAIGSVMRYGITLLLPRATDASFPAATLLINLLGSLAIGLLAGCAVRNAWLSGPGWALLAVGVCGGFTTFSAFALDSVRLLQHGAALTAIIYNTVSIVLGITLCYAGYYFSSSFS